MTRLCCVIGHPVAHSLSPAIHSAALRHDGIDAAYLAFDVPPAELRAAVLGLQALGAVGTSVTIPHKSDAAALAGSTTPDVDAIAATNLLRFTSSGIEAHNTDVGAVARAAQDLAGELAGLECLVLGAGGAARAAVLGLARRGAHVIVCNRTPERVAGLVAQGLASAAVRWEERADASRGRLVVNATSVGLEDDSTPLTDASRAVAVLDVVYRTGETALVRMARAARVPAADGLGMLVWQAAEAYELLWDRPAPREVMLAAALRAAGRAEGAAGIVPPLV